MLMQYVLKNGFALVINEISDTRNNAAYINTKGELITDFSFFTGGDFSEGYAAVANDKGLYGYINTKGKLVIPCQYNSAHEFKEGLAVVSIYKFPNQSHEYIISKQGKVVLDLRMLDFNKSPTIGIASDYISNNLDIGFYHGLIPLRIYDYSIDINSVYIDKKGNVVNPDMKKLPYRTLQEMVNATK